MDYDKIAKTAAAKEKPAKVIEGRELDGFEYDKSKAKVLKAALHSINVALGTLMSASKEFSMIRGSDITPDGKLGGKGFIMPFKDIKRILNETILNLSDITDTVADELTNPQWGLSSQEKKKVKKEQEEIEDQVDDVEGLETPNEETNESDYDSIPEEGENPEEEVVNEDTAPKNENTDSIEEETVEENRHKESTESYRELMSNDRTAAALSRNIMANLLTGIRKNG